MVGERSRPWSPFFNSEQAIVKWPLVTRLLGEGRLNLDLDGLRFWYGRWPTPNPPRIRLIREAEVRGCIVLRRAWHVGQPEGCSVIFMKPWGIFFEIVDASLYG